MSYLSSTNFSYNLFIINAKFKTKTVHKTFLFGLPALSAMK